MPQHARPDVDLTARCACGVVSIAVKGPIHAMFMCSCEDCQRASGTGHATVALASPGDVTITGPTRSFARPANSGALLTRWFCPECGTPLYARSSRAPEALMLPVGLFGAKTTWYVPNQLIFARSHRDWDVMPEGLRMHSTYRNEGGH
ncbi:MAG: Gfa-like protein [Devosia sp.]|uniref:GFA family protein n=1 Tax=Devosia sp. TaxID=1871048 RepID=UPI00261D26F4|nr:GFA family protein [Devosia sp.]MDB5539366.1 Gfa-like protein [Devosia sp.]